MDLSILLIVLGIAIALLLNYTIGLVLLLIGIVLLIVPLARR